MARLIVYYAHPGHKYSHVNRFMARAAAGLEGITFVDLYADYPRFDIDVEIEQRRLLDHDVILFQVPLFWYSTPSIIKEWQDLVLEHGFAYGSGGDALEGEILPLFEDRRRRIPEKRELQEHDVVLEQALLLDVHIDVESRIIPIQVDVGDVIDLRSGLRHLAIDMRKFVPGMGVIND